MRYIEQNGSYFDHHGRLGKAVENFHCRYQSDIRFGVFAPQPSSIRNGRGFSSNMTSGTVDRHWLTSTAVQIGSHFAQR
jgi:hypothetical protein